MSNNLILRTITSPHGDITKGSILSHTDLDNNLIHLKGLAIKSADWNGDILTLKKIDGSIITVPINNDGIGGAYVRLTGDTMTGSLCAPSISASTLENGFNAISVNNFSHSEGYLSVAGLYAYHSSSVVNGIITLDENYGDVSSKITYILSNGLQILYYDSVNEIKIIKTNSVSFNDTNTIIVLNENINSEDALIGASVITDDIFPSNYQHSEGYNNFAYGNASHSEGHTNFSIGNSSHSEGNNTITLGFASHAEGNNTISEIDFQHVSGRYNTIGNTNNNIAIIGCGSDDNNRADAFRVDLISGTTATIILPQVINLNYENDAIAAANGIPIGGLYHTSGTIKIRLI